MHMNVVSISPALAWFLTPGISEQMEQKMRDQMKAEKQTTAEVRAERGSEHITSQVYTA
jgi:hypothetical protein